LNPSFHGGEFFEGGGPSGPKNPIDLQALLNKLLLKDEELDDVVLPIEEFVNLKEGERWMVLLKVHTTKQFRNQPFFQKKKWMWRGALCGTGRSTR
jgi:hypothetical protein